MYTKVIGLDLTGTNAQKVTLGFELSFPNIYLYQSLETGSCMNCTFSNPYIIVLRFTLSCLCAYKNIIIPLVYTTQVNSTFRTPLLASS